MKKSIMIVGIGIFIIVTILLGINTDKMYQKQIHFNSTEEVINQLKTKVLISMDNNGRRIETSDLKECLSERKRLTYSEFNFQKIDIEKVEELDDKQKQAILSDYDYLRKQFTKRRAITKEEPIRLSINSYHSYYDNGLINYNKSEKLKVDLVVIDEGEGLVIDYIMPYKPDEKEGNKDA